MERKRELCVFSKNTTQSPSQGLNPDCWIPHHDRCTLTMRVQCLLIAGSIYPVIIISPKKFKNMWNFSKPKKLSTLEYFKFKEIVLEIFFFFFELCTVSHANYSVWIKDKREKQQNKLVEWKAFWLIPWGLRVPICDMNFCSLVLLLSVLPWWRVRPQLARPFSTSRKYGKFSTCL